MSKIVDKLWKDLCESLCEKCEKNYYRLWNFIKIGLNCEKKDIFTQCKNGFALSFTQSNYLCLVSKIYTISTGFITTIINNLLKKTYNINRRCV